MIGISAIIKRHASYRNLFLFLVNSGMTVPSRLINILPLKLYLSIKHYSFRLRSPRESKKYQETRCSEKLTKYTYKPFVNNKCILVHVPKCAGVSIKKAIFGRDRVGGHKTLDQYCHIFGPNEITKYYKFTIVRNPFDRLVSAFFFLSKGGLNEADRKWAMDNISEFEDFRAFVKKWLDKSNIREYHHFRPQYFYFLDRHKKLKVDYFAFFENIDEDLEHIANNIGKNIYLGKTNTSGHDNYMKYYDDETIEIVSNVYSEDLKLLEYSFDNSSLKDQIEKRNKFPDFPYRNRNSIAI